MQDVFILLLLPVTILCNWLMFKGNWVTVEKNLDHVPEEL